MTGFRVMKINLLIVKRFHGVTSVVSTTWGMNPEEPYPAGGLLRVSLVMCRAHLAFAVLEALEAVRSTLAVVRYVVVLVGVYAWGLLIGWLQKSLAWGLHESSVMVSTCTPSLHPIQINVNHKM